MAAMTAALPGTRAEARIVSPPQNDGSETKGSSNTAFAWAHRTAKASKRTEGTKAAKGRKESERKQEAVDRRSAVKDHLVVLVNGVAGSPMNWTYTKAQLEAYGDPHLLVHSCESLRRTVDGVDVVGNRLADEVRQVIHRNPQLRRISFIAHSLGGVLSRYAIAQMYHPTCPPASHEPSSHEQSAHDPPSREPPSHEPPSRDSTSGPSKFDPCNCDLSADHLHRQTSQHTQPEDDYFSSFSRTPPPEEHSPDTTFPTCASTSSLPSDAPSLPRHLMPKSPSVSVLDVLRRQEEQLQVGDSGFPPMLCLDAEDDAGGSTQEEEWELAAGESEGERATEPTSTSVDGGCNVQGEEEEDVEEEEEGNDAEDEEEVDEDGKTGEQYRGPRIAGLEPMNFVTLASPHLGSRGKGHLPFLLRVSLFERASVPLAPLFLGRSARHLFLTDVDPPVETPDSALDVDTIDIDTADANPHIGSTGAEPQIETAGAANTRIDTTTTGGADHQPGTADVDAMGDAVAGTTQADGAYGNHSTGCVDLLNAASGAEPPLGTDTTLSSSVDTGRPLADLSANPAAETLAVGAEANLGQAGTRSSGKGGAVKQQQATPKEQQQQQQQQQQQDQKQQQHGMFRLHRLGSSMIDVTRVAAAEGRSEETTEKGVGSHKVKHQLPLLLRMTTDNEEGPFLSALASFKYRAAYANVSGDLPPAPPLSARPPTHQPDELHELPDYRFIVRVQHLRLGFNAAAAAAAASSVVDFARTDTTGALAAEASDFVAGNATGGLSGGPSGGASGGPSGGSAACPPETKEHANFFARLKVRWKMGGRTASTGGFGLNFGFGSPQQQFLPCQQQPLKLKDKGHTEQGEGGGQAFENLKETPDDPPDCSPEEGQEERLQLVRSMSEGMVPRGASGRGSGGGGSGASSEEGSGKGDNRRAQGATKNDEGHGGHEGWRGDESKARRASIGGPTAAAGAGGGGALLPRAAAIAPKKHSIHMQWEGGIFSMPPLS
ncbi:unnamed protein product [Closterium sp. Naga37s-1]|nr:unnamed protein product [Closterium sp. Naga37s-1]